MLRFWNSDVMTNLEGVVEAILDALRPLSQPSPAGGNKQRRP